jgi:hypothetical protein
MQKTTPQPPRGRGGKGGVGVINNRFLITGFSIKGEVLITIRSVLGIFKV